MYQAWSFYLAWAILIVGFVAPVVWVAREEKEEG